MLDRLIAKADVLVENSGRARWPGSDSTTRRSSPTHPRLDLLLDLRLRPDRTAPRRSRATTPCMQAEGGLMSITGRPTVRPSASAWRSPTSCPACSPRRESRRRSMRASARDAASTSTSRCSTRSRRCSPIRPESTSRPARRRRGWATGIRRSCRTRRSRRPTASSCSPSATTISGGGSARSPASMPATVRDQPRAGHGLRRAAADGRRACCGRSRAATGSRGSAAGVPCGSVRDLHEVFADPQIAAREHDRADARIRRPATSACSARR